MDRLDTMAMLLTVVQAGSLSAAGRQLHVPVPTLSRRLSDLEARLGTRLLIRTTRKLTLTEAGIAYLAAARRILDQVEEAERTAAGEFITPKGELVISAPILFGRLHVLPIVADFLAQFPEVNIRMSLSDRNVDLVDDHVDLAVRIGHLPDSAMIATRLGVMRTVICASPVLLAEHGTPQNPGELRRMPGVTFEGPASSFLWQSRPAGSATAIELPVTPRLSVSTAEAACAAAISGVGVTRLLHYQVADAIADGALRIVLEAFEPEPSPIHLVHAAHGQMPIKMRRFLDFAAPRLRNALERPMAGGELARQG